MIGITNKYVRWGENMFIPMVVNIDVPNSIYIALSKLTEYSKLESDYISFNGGMGSTT